jgi:DNA repair protein RecO (recombination protein O)
LLRSAAFGEADRVVTLLTRAHGKLACIARGARKSKTRFAGTLEPLCPLRVSLDEARGPLPSLRASELVRYHGRLLADRQRMAAAFAGLELLRELCPEHAPEPEQLDLGLELLETLDDAAAAPTAVLACFELKTLSLAGFAPRLDTCGTCGKRARTTQSARFDPIQGHLICSACGRAPMLLSASTRAALTAVAEQGLREGAVGLTDRDARAAHTALHAFAEHRIGRALKAQAATGA